MFRSGDGQDGRGDRPRRLRSAAAFWSRCRAARTSVSPQPIREPSAALADQGNEFPAPGADGMPILRHNFGAMAFTEPLWIVGMPDPPPCSSHTLPQPC